MILKGAIIFFLGREIHLQPSQDFSPFCYQGCIIQEKNNRNKHLKQEIGHWLLGCRYQGQGNCSKMLFWQIFYLRGCFTKCLLCCSQFIWDFFFFYGREKGEGRGESNAHKSLKREIWHCHNRQSNKQALRISQLEDKNAPSSEILGLSYFQTHAQKYILTPSWNPYFFQNSSYHFLQCSPSGLSPEFSFNNSQ